MKTKLRKYQSICLILMIMIFSCLFTGCVNQHPKDSKKSSQSESVETMLEITDQKEKQAVLNAKAKVKAMSGEPRIVVTSPAVADICDKLDLDLVKFYAFCLLCFHIIVFRHLYCFLLITYRLQSCHRHNHLQSP